jgi:allantoin racemase
MGPLDRRVQDTLGVPVIDGVAAAVKMLEALAGYGLFTSRVAAFKAPEPKELTGETDVLRAFRAVSMTHAGS